MKSLFIRHPVCRAAGHSFTDWATVVVDVNSKLQARSCRQCRASETRRLKNPGGRYAAIPLTI